MNCGAWLRGLRRAEPPVFRSRCAEEEGSGGCDRTWLLAALRPVSNRIVDAEDEMTPSAAATPMPKSPQSKPGVRVTVTTGVCVWMAASIVSGERPSAGVSRFVCADCAASRVSGERPSAGASRLLLGCAASWVSGERPSRTAVWLALVSETACG